ncbi:thiopurine S-methyltransferase [Endothiovibrio diazotrophicus]
MPHAPNRRTPATPSVDADNRQDNPLWLKMWRDNRTAEFHQTTVNPLLARYWHGQKLKRGSRILVPLCGKSLDMLWLAEQGYRVIGIELSPVAVKAFFDENRLKVKKTRNGKFTRWQSGAIVIWCGDFFSLQRDRLGHIDSVFDRAALTALPKSVRKPYVAQLRALIDDVAGVFLLSVEDVAKDSGQSATQIDREITTLYAEHFEIRLAHAQRIDAVQDGSPEPGFFVDNKIYQLNLRPTGIGCHS